MLFNKIISVSLANLRLSLRKGKKGDGASYGTFNAEKDD